MKVSDFKKIIKESIREVIREEMAYSRSINESFMGGGVAPQPQYVPPVVMNTPPQYVPPVQTQNRPQAPMFNYIPPAPVQNRPVNQFPTQSPQVDSNPINSLMSELMNGMSETEMSELRGTIRQAQSLDAN